MCVRLSLCLPVYLYWVLHTITCSIISQTLVMYAPLIGGMGLDIARKCSRETLALKKSAALNSPLPFYPEIIGYGVCEIKKGEDKIC